MVYSPTRLNVPERSGDGFNVIGKIHEFMTLFAMIPAAENVVTMALDLVGENCK